MNMSGLDKFGLIGVGYFFFWRGRGGGGRELAIGTFVKVLRPVIVKCLNEKEPYRESS